MYSVSKTMTGLAVGMLAEEGKLNIDQPVADFFQDLLPEHPDGRILRQTIRDILRMDTCYYETAYREREDADWTRPFFTGKPTHEQGYSDVIYDCARLPDGENCVVIDEKGNPTGPYYGANLYDPGSGL